MKIRKLYLVLIAFSIIVISCSNNEQEQTKDETIPVKTAKVLEKEVSIPIHTSGRLKSKKEVKLSFKTGGIVSKIFVSDGDEIKKGETLAKLNLEEIQSQFNQAKINYDKTLRDFDRIKSLYKDSVVTLEQFQNMQSGLDVAKSGLNIAQFNLKYSTITSPFDGKIYKKLVEENEIVSPGMPIFIVGSDDQGWQVLCGVTDNDITNIKIGDEAKVNFDSYKNSFDAKVSKIAASANPMNGLFDVELTLSKSEKGFVSGLISSVDIYTSSKKITKEIPIHALVEADGEKGFVFSPDQQNNSVKKVQVDVIDIHDENVLVKFKDDSILDVITEGVEFLNDGSKIKIISN